SVGALPSLWSLRWGTPWNPMAPARPRPRPAWLNEFLRTGFTDAVPHRRIERGGRSRRTTVGWLNRPWMETGPGRRRSDQAGSADPELHLSGRRGRQPLRAHRSRCDDRGVGGLRLGVGDGPLLPDPERRPPHRSDARGL